MRPQNLSQSSGVFVIDPLQSEIIFEGWGTSLCWWGHALGRWEKENLDPLMDALFDPAIGLGLNIIRYNIGGGENPTHDHFREGGRIPGFQPIKGKYDWEADGFQRKVMFESMKRGVNIVEAFSNSPPYYMTRSDCSAGNFDARLDNLKDDYVEDFVDYLTEVTKYYRDTWQLEFDTLEPFNEPTTSFWEGFYMNQEGCHFQRETINKVLPALYNSLQRKFLKTKISAVDDTDPEQAYLTYKYLTKESQQVISQYNTHSYGGGYGPKAMLSQLMKDNGKKLWMSEVGIGVGGSLDDIAGGVYLSKIILSDIQNLKCSAWIIWQAVENQNYNNSYGLLQAPFFRDSQTFVYSKQYYVMMQYTRFIRPNARILACDDPRTLVSLDSSGSNLSIISTNLEDNQSVLIYDLKAFSISSYSQISTFRTSETENFKDINNSSILSFKNSYIHFSIPPQSVTSIRIQGISVALSKL